MAKHRSPGQAVHGGTAARGWCGLDAVDVVDVATPALPVGLAGNYPNCCG